MAKRMTTKPYARFALHYDQMGADHHSVRMVEYTDKIFRKFKIRPTVGLDLCCGTGTAIELLADRGILMAGLDRSAEMLAVAAMKLKGRSVQLYCKELPRFKIIDNNDSSIERQFDLITCFYDSLNYLNNSRELKAAFRSIYLHTRPGGWFIFDMNTPAALETLWGDQVIADTRDNLAWIWKSRFDKPKCKATLTTTFFEKSGRGWNRHDETHIEYAWENETIKRLLGETGFLVKGFYKCHTFNRPGKKTCRVCGVVLRPA